MRVLGLGVGVSGLVVGVWGLGLGILERALRMFVTFCIVPAGWANGVQSCAPGG